MVDTALPRSLHLICATGLALGMQTAVAQTDEAPLQRVEITGSSIRRIAAEGALPVQTLTRAQIEQSGATSVADLVATLPSMQGYTTASMSINGGGGGLQTASLHGIGEGYTLVLLNGRRLAPANSGATVNLASIPLAAVERVEILADGANTLYGSDAIAGVVNFILKKNQTDAVLDATYSQPRRGGGATSTASISKGWGDLEQDGVSLLLSASHEETRAAWAQDFDFAKSGVIPFTANGQRYSLYQLSSNAIPATAIVRYTDPSGKPGNVSFSPNLFATGACNGPQLFQLGNRCLYDFTATVQSVPALKRDSVVAALNYKLNDHTHLFVDALASSFSNTAQYAAPAQPLGLPLNSPLYARSIAPYLARLGVPNGAAVSGVSVNLRLLDAGRRADEYQTDARHLAFGGDTSINGVAYRAAYTHSDNRQIDSAAGGYLGLNAFSALVDAGRFDPFAPPGDAARAALAPAVLQQRLSRTRSSLDLLQASAVTDLFALPAGAAQLALGADFTMQKYAEAPEAIIQGPNQLQPGYTDAIIGRGTGALPIDARRDSWGAYGELLLPLRRNLDLTASTRYDDYAAVRNDQSFDAAGRPAGSARQGAPASKATYKLALRWNPAEALLIRGSYGTGFKAPSMSNIVKPLTYTGPSAFHACPIKVSSDPRFPLCVSGSSEYGLMSSGNASSGERALRPEQSKQATLGFRFDASAALSLGFDLWDVRLSNQIQALSEDAVFSNPQLYSDLIRAYVDPVQKQPMLVAVLTPFNLASSHFQGVDWDHSYRRATAYGKLGLQWTGTYLSRSEQQTPGSGVEHNIGRFNTYANVSFRWISALTASLQSGRYTHTLAAHYRSGYRDQVYTKDNTVVRIVLADGSLGDYVPLARDVSSYTTIDWQTRAQLGPQVTLTAGIKNLANIDPPFSVRNAGGGNQSGYDGRYADPLGRQFYLSGQYRF